VKAQLLEHVTRLGLSKAWPEVRRPRPSAFRAKSRTAVAASVPGPGPTALVQPVTDLVEAAREFVDVGASDHDIVLDQREAVGLARQPFSLVLTARRAFFDGLGIGRSRSIRATFQLAVISVTRSASLARKRRSVSRGVSRRWSTGMAGGSGSNPLRQGRQLIGALAPAGLEAHPLVPLAALDGEVQHRAV